MTDIFPQRNLPDQAEAWGREIEDRIKDIGKKVSVVANTTRNTNLVAVKSAEAADHNVRRVEIQVEALEAAVNEKTRAVLDEAIEELREAEIVMEAQFEAHDVSLAEAETAIGSLELATVPETMAAAVGVFIDAMMQHLTVTGVANIHQVVADELYTKMAVVQKLQATESIVTKDMIATGAVTSDKIAAGAVSADMVDVGQNAKWDSNGLLFYAPPFPDQAWDDWENRAPIISLTPAGDVSVTVAQGGQPTAGMEATGLVHGDRGEFNSLTVGGENLDDLLNRQGGIISAHRLAETVQTAHSEVRLLTIPILIMPGRQYEIQFQLAASGAAGLWARIRQSASGVPTTGNSIQREHLWQIGDGQKVVQFSHFISENETTSTVPPEGLMLNVGLFAAGNSAVTMNYFGSGWGGKPRTYAIVKEIGPLIEWDVQQVSAPIPPKKNYSGSVKATGWWRGFAQDGRHTVDTRATVAGRYYGTDMHEHVVVEVSNMQSTLSGSEVTGGSVTVRQSSSSGGFGDVRWNIGFMGTARPGSFSGVTYFATNVNFPKGVAVKVSIPAAHRDKLRTGAFKSIVISPTHGASLSSYGYVDILATKVDFNYRK